MLFFFRNKLFSMHRKRVQQQRKIEISAYEWLLFLKERYTLSNKDQRLRFKKNFDYKFVSKEAVREIFIQTNSQTIDISWNFIGLLETFRTLSKRIQSILFERFELQWNRQNIIVRMFIEKSQIYNAENSGFCCLPSCFIHFAIQPFNCSFLIRNF